MMYLQKKQYIVYEKKYIQIQGDEFKYKSTA